MQRAAAGLAVGGACSASTVAGEAWGGGGYTPSVGDRDSGLVECHQDRDAARAVAVEARGAPVVLPAAWRRRFGRCAGVRIEALEESDGLQLRVVGSVGAADVAAMVGTAKAPARGVPRRTDDLAAASLLTRPRRGKS